MIKRIRDIFYNLIKCTSSQPVSPRNEIKEVKREERKDVVIIITDNKHIIPDIEKNLKKYIKYGKIIANLSENILIDDRKNISDNDIENDFTNNDEKSDCSVIDINETTENIEMKENIDNISNYSEYSDISIPENTENVKYQVNSINENNYGSFELNEKKEIKELNDEKEEQKEECIITVNDNYKKIVKINQVLIGNTNEPNILP